MFLSHLCPCEWPTIFCQIVEHLTFILSVSPFWSPKCVFQDRIHSYFFSSLHIWLVYYAVFTRTPDWWDFWNCNPTDVQGEFSQTQNCLQEAQLKNSTQPSEWGFPLKLTGWCTALCSVTGSELEQLLESLLSTSIRLFLNCEWGFSSHGSWGTKYRKLVKVFEVSLILCTNIIFTVTSELIWGGQGV